MIAVKPIPPGFGAVTPYLAIHHARKTIEFLKAAFNAEEVQTHTLPDGRILNAIIRIRDSMLFIGERPADAAPWPAMLYMYVEDVDAVFDKAVKAGAKVVMAPVDQFYGERSGAVEDPSGNQWWIAAQIEQLSENELVARATERSK
ncbi:MAG: VOC family protein [Steroidobacteraceae bacterium]